MAAEYGFIIPNPAGSSSDVVARTIADEYNRLTGNILVIDYALGADGQIAVAKFKTQNRLSVILGTSTMHVFNYVYKDNLPYSDVDFDHAAWIGWTPSVWYVRSDSPLKTMEDVNARLRSQQIINIGADNLSVEANVISLKKYHPFGNAVEIIKYKGAPQVYTDILGGHIELAVASMTSFISSSVEDGKIRVLSTTSENPIKINGAVIPTAQNVLGVNQFNGAFLISVSPGYGTESQKLKEDLLRTVNSPAVKEKLAKINIDVIGRDGNFARRAVIEYREKLNKLK
jgi:tripartite-type tricarboxylate transporter receptor subunit TctC